jgi:hypothetical protein
MPVKKRALLFTALAGLVFAAMYMPWTQFVVEKNNGEIVVSAVQTAWEGTTTIFWIAVPQWAVFVAAAALAAMAWLEVYEALTRIVTLDVALIGYGLVYSSIHCLKALADAHSRIGLGALLTVLAFCIYGRIMLGGTGPLWPPPESPPDNASK